MRDWYRNAELTPAAQQRFGFKGCCDHADVVRTHFRVSQTNYGDAWEFWDDGAPEPGWRDIPADIIHVGEHAPDGRATLFRLGGSGGALVCFWPPDGGL